ncbi:hypothetical protein YB2330_005366 [Saitoella coloradoensis]
MRPMTTASTQSNGIVTTTASTSRRGGNMGSLNPLKAFRRATNGSNDADVDPSPPSTGYSASIHQQHGGYSAVSPGALREQKTRVGNRYIAINTGYGHGGGQRGCDSPTMPSMSLRHQVGGSYGHGDGGGGGGGYARGPSRQCDVDSILGSESYYGSRDARGYEASIATRDALLDEHGEYGAWGEEEETFAHGNEDGGASGSVQLDVEEYVGSMVPSLSGVGTSVHGHQHQHQHQHGQFGSSAFSVRSGPRRRESFHSGMTTSTQRSRDAREERLQRNLINDLYTPEEEEEEEDEVFVTGCADENDLMDAVETFTSNANEAQDEGLDPGIFSHIVLGQQSSDGHGHGSVSSMAGSVHGSVMSDDSSPIVFGIAPVSIRASPHLRAQQSMESVSTRRSDLAPSIISARKVQVQRATLLPTPPLSTHAQEVGMGMGVGKTGARGLVIGGHGQVQRPRRDTSEGSPVLSPALSSVSGMSGHSQMGSSSAGRVMGRTTAGHAPTSPARVAPKASAPVLSQPPMPFVPPRPPNDTGVSAVKSAQVSTFNSNSLKTPPHPQPPGSRMRRPSKVQLSPSAPVHPPPPKRAPPKVTLITHETFDKRGVPNYKQSGSVRDKGSGVKRGKTNADEDRKLEEALRLLSDDVEGLTAKKSSPKSKIAAPPEDEGDDSDMVVNPTSGEEGDDDTTDETKNKENRSAVVMIEETEWDGKAFGGEVCLMPGLSAAELLNITPEPPSSSEAVVAPPAANAAAKEKEEEVAREISPKVAKVAGMPSRSTTPLPPLPKLPVPSTPKHNLPTPAMSPIAPTGTTAALSTPATLAPGLAPPPTAAAPPPTATAPSLPAGAAAMASALGQPQGDDMESRMKALEERNRILEQALKLLMTNGQGVPGMPQQGGAFGTGGQ